jgi:hypothetical protein
MKSRFCAAPPFAQLRITKANPNTVIRHGRGHDIEVMADILLVEMKMVS